MLHLVLIDRRLAANQLIDQQVVNEHQQCIDAPVFEPPRELAEIDADLKQVTDRILTMIAGLSA